MRKALIILAIVALSLVSCNKENPIDFQEVDEEPITNVSFKLTANHPDGTTKAVKTGWESGDVIFVFFNNIAAPRYLKMSYDGSDWNYTQMNGVSEESLGLAENATGTMRAIFLPFASDTNISADGTSFIFSKTTYSYYLTATLDYTVAGGVVSGAFNMQIPDGYIQFFLDDASATSSSDVELREPHLTPQGISSISADGTITHTSIASGAPLTGYVYNKTIKETGESIGYLFSGILAADARGLLTNYYFTLIIGGWQGSYYSKEFSEKVWYRGPSVGRALKMPAISNWTEITHFKPIDLGTDVIGKRVYWSDCNLGASVPKEYGDYYAWGEIEPYYTDGHSHDDPCNSWRSRTNKPITGYNWESYKWNYGTESFPRFTRYNTASSWGVVDNKTQFQDYDYVDDAAHAVLGGKWHTPTRNEWSVLMFNCSWLWTTNYDGTGVRGMIVTCNIDGHKDRSIFIPAAGTRGGKTTSYKDARGGYWSSSLNGSYPDDAGYLYFDSEGVGSTFIHRYNGCSIRPACD